MSKELDELSILWLESKEKERMAVEARRIYEDQMLKIIAIAEDFEGTKNSMTDAGLEIKVVGRMNRKVDADKLQDIAAEHGLTEHLATLFRWKPEINATAWKASDDSITRPLLDAITTTPGRPSFSITKKD
jgi:hypothetical protein